MLNGFRDENEGTYGNGDGGEAPAVWPPDMSIITAAVL